MKRVTIKDVAKQAGVSYSTVSHVLNDTRYVAPKTLERVKRALQSLEYYPNISARSLRGGKTKTIGLIIPDTSNLFFAEVSRKIEDRGFQKGYSVIVCNSDNDPKKQKAYIDTLVSKKVDGVIFISSDCEQSDLESFRMNNVSVVVADRDIPLDFAEVVLLDNEKGGYLATKHLLDLGHKEIACITGPNFLSPSMQRVQGYKRALLEFGLCIDEELIETGDFTFSGGEEAMRRLIAKNPGLTGVFVLNDMMAIGAMNVARIHNYHIPQDISFVGFDDVELAMYVSPRLTTIAQPIIELSNYAVGLLIERMERKLTDLPRKRIILSPKLIIRETTSKTASNE